MKIRHSMVNLSQPPVHLYSGGWGQMDGEWAETIQPTGMWTVYFYYHSNAVTIDGQTYLINEGDMGVFPPASRIVHAATGEGTGFDYLMFNMPGTGLDRGAVPHVLRDMKESHREWQMCGRRMMDTLSPLRAYAWGLMCTYSVNKSVLRDHGVIYEAEDWIVRNLGRNFGVSELCQDLNVSPRHLLRAFRLEHGTTIQEYIMQRRIREAARLLKTTEMQPKLVAQAVGIPNLQHFNKLMRLRTGASPRAFRTAGTGFQAID